MITYAEYQDLILSGVGVDASSSQRYLPDQDIIPSCNSALSRAITAGNWALANRKGSEEMLRELMETRVFQSNAYGGIALENTTPPLGHNVWSILAIYAEPTTIPANPTTLPLEQLTYFLTGVVFLSSDKPVERLTLEEIAKAKNNAFMSGNETLAQTPMRSYAYTLIGKRTDSPTVITGDYEIHISPASLADQKRFAITYLRQPSTITTVNDTIDLPNSMLRTLADWGLQYLAAFKQGSGSLMLPGAEADARELFRMQVD